MRATKRTYGWPEDAQFLSPTACDEHFAERGRGAGRGGCARSGSGWSSATSASTRRLRAQIDQMQRRELPDGWDTEIPSFDGRPEGAGDAQGRPARC